MATAGELQSLLPAGRDFSATFQQEETTATTTASEEAAAVARPRANKMPWLNKPPRLALALLTSAVLVVIVAITSFMLLPMSPYAAAVAENKKNRHSDKDAVGVLLSRTAPDAASLTPFKNNGDAATGAPNVIFVLLDDVGVNDLGPDSTDLSAMTPFVNSLASRGVRITKHYANSMCTPSRVSRGQL